MKRLILVPLIALTFAVGACSGDDGGSDDAPAGTTGEAMAKDEKPDEAMSGAEKQSKPEAAMKPGTGISTGESQFGEVLFDRDQRAIYYFDKEKTSTSECYGDCAVAWPPVLTDGEPKAFGNAEDKLLGATKRKDGQTQVTYDGRPLYYYVDEPAGQVLCHNVDQFGGLWLAVLPDGAPVS